jgi:multiple sugar transport system substrate-binding protein
MLRKRSALLGLLLIVLLMSLGMMVKAQDPLELRMTWWGSQNRHDRTIAVIEAYEAANPGIDITYEFANFNDYWTQVNTQAAGGQLACIMQQDYAYLAEWSERGLLAPLDPFVEDGTIDLTNVDESYLAGGIVDGQMYGISLGTNSQSIILDVDAFEAAGLELPAEDWTWADFEATAVALHEALGIWGYGSPSLGDDQIWTGMINSLGWQPFNDDGTALGYEDDQPVIDHYNMILRLQESGAAATLEQAAEFAAGPENSPIVTAQAAMQYQWSNQVVAVFAAAGEDRHFRLWPLPRAGENSANFLKPSMFFSIPASCENQTEAAAFINYFTNDLAANEVLMAERGVPISSEVSAHLLPLLDAVGQETFNFLEWVTPTATPIFPPNPAGYNDLRANIYAPLFHDPVLYGQISVEEGVAIFRSEANALLGSQ